MPYLNVDPDYFDHPKVANLKSDLGECADIYPIRLWRYAAKFFCLDGVLLGMDALSIEQAMLWHGEPGKAVDSLVRHGFLSKAKNFRINDWNDHQGHLVAFKKRGSLAAKARWGKLKPNSTAMLKQCNGNTPYHTIPNHTNINKHSVSSSEFNKDFELIWKDYPNKDGKKLALRSFSNSVKTEGDLEDIKTALKNYLASDRVSRGFIKNGSTWFGNWRDWINFNDTKPQSKDEELMAKLRSK